MPDPLHTFKLAYLTAGRGQSRQFSYNPLAALSPLQAAAIREQQPEAMFTRLLGGLSSIDAGSILLSNTVYVRQSNCASWEYAWACLARAQPTSVCQIGLRLRGFEALRGEAMRGRSSRHPLHSRAATPVPKLASRVFGGKRPAGESGGTHTGFAVFWLANQFGPRTLQSRVYVLAVLCIRFIDFMERWRTVAPLNLVSLTPEVKHRFL